MHVQGADGVSLHVQTLGEGPPLVMLHGLLVGNMTTWYFHAAPELAKRYRVILFDLRGHGMSARAPRGYDVPSMTKDLEAVIDQVAGGPAAVCGHSYGAAVALAFALRRPEKVTKLAVVEAPLPPSKLDELESFLGKSPDAMLEALPDTLKDALAFGGRRGRRFVEAMRFLAQESTLFEDLRHNEDVPDERLRALALPLLAVYGTESSCRPVGARLARTVPGARHEEIAGGHFLPLEAPALLTQALARFF